MGSDTEMCPSQVNITEAQVNITEALLMLHVDDIKLHDINDINLNTDSGKTDSALLLWYSS